MGLEAGAARQLAGLLRGGGIAFAAQRIARLVAEAYTGSGSADAARFCGMLRDSLAALAEEGTLSSADLRMLIREIDAAQAAALEGLSNPRRALEALERAVSGGSTGDLPRLALEGAASADSAALLNAESGALVLRTGAGLELPAEAMAPQSLAAQALAERKRVEASDQEGSRAVVAFPLRSGAEIAGILRVSSRTVWQFSPDELGFLEAIASRAAGLLAKDEPQTRLRHALLTFESLIEASPLPIVSNDREGRVQIWNRAAEELFGWQRGEVLGKPNPMLPPEPSQESSSISGEIDAGAVIRNREVRRTRKDGTTLHLALSIAPLREPSGDISGAIAILADITDRKQSEEEMVRTAGFREHLIGIVSHDLRNPLTAIVTSTQLLLRYGELHERQARVVARISASANRMTRMIDDLLDFARTRLGGEFPIRRRRVDLRQICEQTVEELEFAYTREVNLDSEGDLWGDWDADRMAQVISNLVGNALQHSDGQVEVTLRGESDEVLFRTRNGGPPIPADVLPHVFEPGRRGNGARSGGVGLGLFIARQIVLAHGGTIEARSSEAEGTIFEIALPRKARQKT
ncbi:MAG TPA: ATP-binding protein [Myxococcales bacterium]|nr:ATP-binding protein [Myxococcales bacterium]